MKQAFTILFLLTPFFAPAQVTIKMKREGGVSTIPCKVNGLGLNFIFDTGASEVSMSMTEASFMLKNGYLKKEDILGTANYLDANGNISEGITINLKEINIEGLIIKNIKASVVKNLKAPLLLGQSALRKLGKIQFDLETNTITINPATIKTEESIDTVAYSAELIVDTVAVDSVEIEQDEIYFQSGLRKNADGNYQEAITDFDYAIELNNSDPRYFLNRAFAKDFVGDLQGALLDYGRTIKLDPKNSLVYSYRADTKYNLGDTIGALTDLQSALILDPKNEYAYRERGHIKLNRKNYAGAIADLSKAIELNDEINETYYLRALSKYYLKNYAGAQSDFDKAIAIFPTDARAWAIRGDCKFELKNYQGALRDFDKAIELDPELGLAYRFKGALSLHNDDLEEAISYFEKAVELDADDLYASLQLELTKRILKERIWISIGSSNDGDEYFMKTEIESSDYDGINIWLKTNRKKYVHKAYGKSTVYQNAYDLILASVDCSAKKLKFTNGYTYSSSGKLIDSFDNEYGDWSITPPGSVGAAIVKAVCERYGR